MINVEQLAEFIHFNNTGHQKCGYVGSTVADIVHDLEEGLKDSSYLLYDGNEICGSITLDIFDAGGDGQRDIEVWGPFRKDDDRRSLERLLFYLHEVTRSGDIRNIHFFISEDNRLVMDYLAGLTIEKSNGHYHYSADLTGYSPYMDHSGLSFVRMNQSEQVLLHQLLELHDISFVDSIFTREDIISEAEDSKHSDYDIYSVLHGGNFVGYIIVRRNELTSTINLEYLCVVPGQRSKGLGKLMTGFILDTYSRLQYSRMDLVVSENNGGAIHFYDRLNFFREAKMRHIIVNGAIGQ